MRARRYKDSYRLVERLDPRTGRVRTAAEYAGAHYHFPEGEGGPRRRALRLAPWLGGYWLAALVYMKTARVTGRCMYALLPVLLGLFPAAYGLMGLFTLLRAPERMTAPQRDRGPGRLVRSALGCGLLTAAGAAGGAVRLSVAGLWPAAWHEPLLAGLAAACALAAFARARGDWRALAEA